jgi:hypothetical protein
VLTIGTIHIVAGRLTLGFDPAFASRTDESVVRPNVDKTMASIVAIAVAAPTKNASSRTWPFAI